MRPPQFAGESGHGGSLGWFTWSASMRPPQFAGESAKGLRGEVRLAGLQ